MIENTENDEIKENNELNTSQNEILEKKKTSFFKSYGSTISFFLITLITFILVTFWLSCFIVFI